MSLAYLSPHLPSGLLCQDVKSEREMKAERWLLIHIALSLMSASNEAFLCAFKLKCRVCSEVHESFQTLGRIVWCQEERAEVFIVTSEVL